MISSSTFFAVQHIAVLWIRIPRGHVRDLNAKVLHKKILKLGADKLYLSPITRYATVNSAFDIERPCAKEPAKDVVGCNFLP
jgi:hypothetical protein